MPIPLSFKTYGEKLYLHFISIEDDSQKLGCPRLHRQLMISGFILYLLGTKYHFYSMPVPALNTTCPPFSMIVIVSLTFVKFVRLCDCSTHYT